MFFKSATNISILFMEGSHLNDIHTLTFMKWNRTDMDLKKKGDMCNTLDNIIRYCLRGEIFHRRRVEKSRLSNPTFRGFPFAISTTI